MPVKNIYRVQGLGFRVYGLFCGRFNPGVKMTDWFFFFVRRFGSEGIPVQTVKMLVEFSLV